MGASSSRAGPNPTSPAPPRSTAERVWAPPGASKQAWGGAYWHHMHLRAIAWPDRPPPHKTIAEHLYLQRLLRDLPCASCAPHALRYYEAAPPNLALGQSYQLWVFDFHNAVSARLGKPQITYAAYEELYRRELLGR